MVIRQEFMIAGIPAIAWGDSTDKVYISVHGQNGHKEEAEFLSEIVCAQGWQVLSFDLPEHGVRGAESNLFNPWTVVPELQKIMEYAKTKWSTRAIYGNSIGAWFSMQAFKDEVFVKCLFVSPILDMQRLIEGMMGWAGVTIEQLKKKKTIKTAFGQTLSWEYLLYAQNNAISRWQSPTHILYADKDNLTERCVVDEFVKRFNCHLTVMDGEHWLHTPQQLEFLAEWVRDNC